jgi:hypothetical protein
VEGEPPLGASSEAVERAQFVFDPARRTIGADDDSARLLTAEAVVALIPTMTGALADDQANAGTDDWPEAASSGRDGDARRARQMVADRHGRRGPLDTGRGPQDVAGDESELTAGVGAPQFDDHGGPAPVAYGTSALGSGAQPTPGHGSAAAFRGDGGRAIPRVGVPAMGGLVPLAPVPPRRPLQRDDSDGPRIRRSRRPHVPASATAPIRRQSVYEERLIKPTDRPAAGPRSRRASVPSWDEILFGTRTRTSD